MIDLLDLDIPEPSNKTLMSKIEDASKISSIIGTLLWVITMLFLAIGFGFQTPSAKFAAVDKRIGQHETTDSLVNAALVKFNLKLDISNRFLCLQATKRDISLSGLDCGAKP